MKLSFVAILFSTLLGTALGNRMRCYDCGRQNTGGPCKDRVTTCGEGESCGFLDRKPQSGPAQTSIPTCVAVHHCNQVETESVGGVTYTLQKNCCFGDLCNSAVARTGSPACILAVAATALVWLLPGL
ncbi:lymphocyte antigen 6 complex locus protein G6d [Thomomys bottae]